MLFFKRHWNDDRWLVWGNGEIPWHDLLFVFTGVFTSCLAILLSINPIFTLLIRNTRMVLVESHNWKKNVIHVLLSKQFNHVTYTTHDMQVYKRSYFSDKFISSLLYKNNAIKIRERLNKVNSWFGCFWWGWGGLELALNGCYQHVKRRQSSFLFTNEERHYSREYKSICSSAFHSHPPRNNKIML